MSTKITTESFKTLSNGKPTSPSVRRAAILAATNGKIDIGKKKKPTK